jgi:hypothetical protein
MLRKTVVALAFMALGCEIPEVETPCTGVDCSGHGECRIVYEPSGERARCFCDSGYLSTPDGLGCYPALTPPDGGA